MEQEKSAQTPEARTRRSASVLSTTSPNRLKSSLSLTADWKGLTGTWTHPLNPMEYQFLLRKPSAVTEEQVEEAILDIGAASSPVCFRDTVLAALHLVLSHVTHSLVFILHSDNEELVYFKSEAEHYPLPKSGVLWEAVRRRSASIIKSSDTIEEADPFRKLVPNFEALHDSQVVLINPIVEKNHHEVIALMMVVCDEPTVARVEKLRWLERNVLVAASRVLRHMTIERDRTRAEGMLSVCSDLIELDTACLSIKILKHIQSTLDVKMCVLFLISESTHELMCSAQNSTALEKEIRIELDSKSIYSRCFLNGEAITLDEVSKDARFNPAIDQINEYEPSSMMCLPIHIQRGEELNQEVIGVAVVCDKVNEKPFTARDQESLAFMLRFCSSMIANTLAFQREQTLKKQNQALLQMAKNLFSQISDLNVLLNEIMNEARTLTNAERCSLFLLDPVHEELVATIFDSNLPDEDTIRIKVGQGIAGLVGETGKFVNIKDAYQHPLFFRDIDKNTGFHTRNMLCFPIKDHQGAVVGVAELCNKIGGNFFTEYDEELAATFSVYCGISLYQSQLYNKMNESQGKSKLATELMIYHMQVFSEDVDKLAVVPIPTCTSFSGDFCSFLYSPRALPEADTITAVLSMMNEMNLLKEWKIQRNTLAKFLLMVKKGYRDPPYHNWFHALSVAHFCYLLYQNCDGLSVLSSLEILALFISCLCHDIDHRGTNNAFQVSSQSTLASLYSSEGSVMERHHFAQTVCILNSESSNIFENFSNAQYKQVLDLIQCNILSTDITHHLRLQKDMEEMATAGYQKSNPDHRMQMCSLLMTSCDLSSSTKEWKWTKRISDLIYTEFFTQGDLERALGNTPNVMMDRNKAFVPAHQLGFIDGIAGPVYKLMSKLLPSGAPVYTNLQENRRIWTQLAKEGKHA